MSSTNEPLELECPNCGPSYFEPEFNGSFFLECHLCKWEKPDPNFKTDISDKVILQACLDFHNNMKKDPTLAKTPDKSLSKQFSYDAIIAKLEEIDHRGLIDYGVSLRTAWVTEKGLKVLNLK